MSNTRFKYIFFAFLTVILLGSGCKTDDPVVIYLIGDSTMADYANNYDENKDYLRTRYPLTGWGQEFQNLFTGTDYSVFRKLFKADSVVIDDRARGGRSTRTFFQEGRWRSVYENLKKGDLVLIQFGHNDGSESKPERYVDLEGYQEYLRLFVNQSREKQAIPIILTPVCRNYPWRNGHLENVHGDYPAAALEVAQELDAYFIDLNQLSMDAFSQKGQKYVSQNYFMNLPAGVYEAYPDGQSDNTHFQPEGAKEVARLVFEALKLL